MTRLVIVEDDEKIRGSLLLQLREEGYAPQALSSAEEALVHFGDGRVSLPHLLLLDVRLPGISGVELVRRLAAMQRMPPTMIISGEASISETVEALRLGVHDFIEKPFSRERLLQSIRNALEHQALKREVARSWWRALSTARARAASAPQSRSIARPFPTISWKTSCSVTPRAPSPTPRQRRSASSRRRTAAPCFSTRSATWI